MGVGYVLEHRSTMDHAVFHDPYLYKVWRWCNMRANFKDSNTAAGVVKRGSFTTGRIRAADELNMSPSRVYRLLHKLAELGSVRIESNSNWTTITVCNYETYQSGTENPEQPADSQRTASGQPADTIKEGKEGKKVIKKKASPVSLEECLKTCEQVNVEISPVWHQWMTYKHERGDKFTPTGLQTAVTHLANKIAEHGVQAVSGAIVRAMASNWAGWDQPNTFTAASAATIKQPQKKNYLAGSKHHDTDKNHFDLAGSARHRS